MTFDRKGHLATENDSWKFDLLNIVRQSLKLEEDSLPSIIKISLIY